MRKSIFAFILLIILSVTGIIFFLQKSPSKIEREPHHNDIIVEQFIHNHLIDENGMIRTNFMSKDGGELYLSESNGLWLEFLSLYGAKDEFENAYFVTEKHLQLKEGIFSWRIL